MNADNDDWRQTAAAVLEHYAFAVADTARIAQGLINLTIAVTARDGTRYILQRLHPVFSDSVNHNLAQVTAHLLTRGLTTPVIVRTRAGALSVSHAGGLWRMLTHIEGVACERLAGPQQARAAGDLLARFHLAVWDYGGDLLADRPPVHDFARHLQYLDTVLGSSRGHRLYASAHTLARELAGAVARNPPFATGPARLVHGDPKISNMLFEPDLHRAVCLIDLDTLARMPLAFELGDALRSWCNTQGEDAGDAAFRLDLFDAAVTAYLARAGQRLEPAERAAIVPATVQIHLELAARFLADTLEERYFGWDPGRYASRGDHNLARARAQLAAAHSLSQQYAEAARIVDEYTYE